MTGAKRICSGYLSSLLLFFFFPLIQSASVTKRQDVGVVCLGSPNIDLPRFDEYDPNELTLQELCVKTEHGGGQPHQHVGGFCANGIGGPQIMFDPTRTGQADTRLFNGRMLLMCQYRCYCQGYDPATQKGPPPGNDNFFDELKNPYLIIPDVVQDFNQEPPPDITEPIHEEGIEVYHVIQYRVNEHIYRVRRGVGQELPVIRQGMMETNNWQEIETFIPEGNRVVECSGALPNFPLPAPYTAEDFQSDDIPPNERLCATALDSGNEQANAGGYCSSLPQRDLQFSDTLTPRWDWTLTGPNVLASLAIRRHCYLNCVCVKSTTTTTSAVPEPTDERPGTAASTNGRKRGAWAIDDSYEVGTEESDGTVRLTNKRTRQVLITVLPPGESSNIEGTPPGQRPAGTCGANHNEFCPQPWNVGAWGPIPGNPSLDQRKPTDGSKDLTQCGNKCEKMADCDSSDADKTCYCAEPTDADIRALGLDPVFPPGPICIAILMQMVKNNGEPNGKRSLPLLDDNDTDEWGNTTITEATRELRMDRQKPLLLNAEGHPLQCLCNSTVRSEKCCHARDGRIWEL